MQIKSFITNFYNFSNIDDENESQSFRIIALRCIVVFLLIAASAGLGAAAYLILRNDENNLFQSEYGNLNY